MEGNGFADAYVKLTADLDGGVIAEAVASEQQVRDNDLRYAVVCKLGPTEGKIAFKVRRVDKMNPRIER